MTTTINLNLKKPEYSDDADIGDINDNMDAIDTAIGALPIGKTLQGQIGTTALPTTAQTLSGAIAEHETDLGEKANKVISATNGHIATLDSSGDLTDSGKSIADLYPTATQISGSKYRINL